MIRLRAADSAEPHPSRKAR
ncbi:hypothetical protein PflQ2_1275 [Pseudomonas fluorescens Q2-87]|uniref:Uncharacterized protein n=1 Tax=Pseudomonas fluorescens (strain Q2-87) TaxID=1038922 RepID=J2YA57_PSEFQ|nr:hypothetical protein PflQ2_1275 [Pseudomonas fluorescens Q2-87]